MYRVLDFNQSQWLTQYPDYNKKIAGEKEVTKMEKRYTS